MKGIKKDERKIKRKDELLKRMKGR